MRARGTSFVGYAGSLGGAQLLLSGGGREHT